MVLFMIYQVLDLSLNCFGSIFLLSTKNLLYPPFDYNLWYDAALVTSKVGKRHALTGFDALMDLFLSRSAFYVFILF